MSGIGNASLQLQRLSKGSLRWKDESVIAENEGGSRLGRAGCAGWTEPLWWGRNNNKAELGSASKVGR